MSTHRESPPPAASATYPANAHLNSTRNPNVLATGDEIAIPAIEPRVEEAMTSRRHVFVARVSRLFLRLRLSQMLGLDVAVGTSVSIGAESLPKLVGETGCVDFAISPFLEQAVVTLANGVAYEVRVGDLEPVETPRGWQSRLVNLGYLGSEAAVDTIEVRSALEEFQCDAGLRVTGRCDEQTQAALVEAHGV